MLFSKRFPAALGTGNPVLVVSDASMPRCLAFGWKHLATAFRAKGFLTDPTVNRFGMGKSGRFLSKVLTAAVGTREPSSTMGGFGMFCSTTLRAVYPATTVRASKRLGRRPPLRLLMPSLARFQCILPLVYLTFLSARSLYQCLHALPWCVIWKAVSHFELLRRLKTRVVVNFARN